MIELDTSIAPHDVKVLRGAECGSDHMLTKSPVEIKYSKQQTLKK